MPLITDLKDIANKIKAVILTIKDDLEIDEDSVYLHVVPQDFSMPACRISLASVQLIRVNPQQGQWQANFLVEFLSGPMNADNRGELILDILATLMVTLMKNPTLQGVTITNNAIEGTTGILESAGRNQGLDACSFMLSVAEEPVTITAVEV